MALIVSTWRWGQKYSHHYVERLHNGVTRHLREPHRFQVFAPFNGDPTKGCMCRLRMFSPEWQRDNNIRAGDRLVCLDLDLVVTDELDPLFARDEEFLILQGANAANPCPFNGSVMMLRAGAHAEVWREFSLQKARAAPFYEFPDDQGWIWYMLKQSAGWQAGADSGIYAFRKPGWPPKSDELPAGARMVAFPGARDPSQFMALPWVREHWR